MMTVVVLIYCFRAAMFCYDGCEPYSILIVVLAWQYNYTRTYSLSSTTLANRD